MTATLCTHTHTHTRTPITHMHLHTHEQLNKVCGSRLNCNKSSQDRRRKRQKERECARDWKGCGERGSTFHIILTVCLGCVICTWHTLAASADRPHSATLSRRGGPTVRRASLLNSVKLHATKHLTAQKLDQQREGWGRGCKLHKTCNRTRRRRRQRRRHCPTVVNDGRQKTQMWLRSQQRKCLQWKTARTTSAIAVKKISYS